MLTTLETAPEIMTKTAKAIETCFASTRARAFALTMKAKMEKAPQIMH